MHMFNPLSLSIAKTDVSEANVLIIERFTHAWKNLTDLLTEERFTIRRVHSVSGALQALLEQVPDIILVDEKFPEHTGMRVCQRLTAEESLRNIPVIILSNGISSHLKRYDAGFGAVDYIVEPCHRQEVLSRVSTYIKLSQFHRHLDNMWGERTRQLQEEIAERRYAEAELEASRQQLRDLTGHLQEVREQERTVIAREIHDELGQSLTVARMDLIRLLRHQSNDSEKNRRELEAVINLLEEAANTARSISDNLRPGMLDILGLGSALEHYVARYQENTGVSCRLNLSHDGEINVSDQVATAAFRIIQETLTNVLKHAEATAVEVHVVDLGAELVLVVQDNGKGMDTENQLKHSHYGLLGIRERVTLLGGRLVIESQFGKGTRVEVNLPHSGWSV